MSWHSIIYGLHVCANLTIPGISQQKTAREDTIDINLIWGEFPSWLQKLCQQSRDEYFVSSWLTETGKPHLSIFELAEGKFYFFQYPETVKFVVSSDAKAVWGNWQDTCSLEFASLIFLGPIMGFLLRLRGTTCLHASCLVVNNSAIAIIGPSGAGKSTTVAAFAAKGYPILSDDVVPLMKREKQYCAIPGYPRLRLWPESAVRICGEEKVLPCLAPNYDKRYLTLPKDTFCHEPYPLQAIYLLDYQSETKELAMIDDGSAQNFIQLVANTYRPELLNPIMRKQEFFFLTQLLNQTKVRRIVGYRDFAKLPQLCDLILDNSQLLSAESSSLVKKS